MIAVADTSPLCYLILAGEIDLLPSVFGQVFLPEAVRAELLHEDAPGFGVTIAGARSLDPSHERA